MVSRQEILEHVARLLDSRAVHHFPEHRQTARILCGCCSGSNEESLKETALGISCFGRSPGYDTKLDPIVRVTARRLRNKLELFYQNEGENCDLRIVLPKGTYVPKFNRWSNPPR